ncbi:ABC transporter permease [Rhizobium paranaense]|uniref:ABC-type polysaccharide/polyol phosphate export permease n=1 Tax=Rhizobium paranaense TaxID=1650438 RepID=A0A7W8XY19_9HYPH|nr:ABC transporter permease [Rhizobium paranaense]MBB5577642.1 ABC-type polysaccharide/polyol phosphate export permease [Rhizobium paranaense]
MVSISKMGLSDLVETLRRLPLALYFAWGDTRARYRRSILGPLWLVLGTAVGVVGLGFVWSELLHVDKATFIPSLSIGLIVWQLIAGCVMEASSIFVQNAKLIRNLKTPLLIFPLQLLIRQTINFSHNLLVVIGVFFLFPPPLVSNQILVVPGIILVLGNLFWINALVGLLGARYRDIGPLIAAFMPLMFFITPVIYRPQQLAMAGYIAWVNPFTYLVTLIRDPLEGVAPPLFVYGISAGSLLAGFSATLWILGRKYGRIAFWV